MGFKVNPERWLPMGQYLRMVVWFLTHDMPPSPYDKFYKSKWDRRISHVKTLDGPIHTLWVHSTRIRYNWFTIGWHCWRKGHEWKNQFVTDAPDFEWEGEGGRLQRKPTGKTRVYHVRSCAYCGHYMGAGWEFR